MVGGVVSAGITWVTFRPMGHRLADALVQNLNGELDDRLERNAEFAATLDAVVVAPAEEIDGASTTDR